MLFATPQDCYSDMALVDRFSASLPGAAHMGVKWHDDPVAVLFAERFADDDSVLFTNMVRQTFNGFGTRPLVRVRTSNVH